MSDHLNSKQYHSNNEPNQAQPQAPSDLHQHQKENILTNGENFIGNYSANASSNNIALSSSKEASSHDILETIAPQSSTHNPPSHEAVQSTLEIGPVGSLDQSQTAITGSAPPIVVPPLSDVRDESAQISGLRGEEMAEKEEGAVITAEDEKAAESELKTGERGVSGVDGTEDATVRGPKLEGDEVISAEPMDVTDDVGTTLSTGDVVDLPHRSAPQSTAGDEQAVDAPAPAQAVTTETAPTTGQMPAATSAPSTDAAEGAVPPNSIDQEMADPPLSAKFARSRDDEGEDDIAPSAKRSKTDDAIDSGVAQDSDMSIKQTRQQEEQHPGPISQLQSLEGADAALAKAGVVPSDDIPKTSSVERNEDTTASTDIKAEISQEPDQIANTATAPEASQDTTTQTSQTSQTSHMQTQTQTPNPTAPQQNSTLLPAHNPPQFDDTPLTKAQQKFLLERLRNSKKIKAAAAFLQPVNPVALGIPTYLDIIKQPMDMSTMESKLKADQYNTVNAFLADFSTMVQNSVTFNGREHAVSQAGLNLQAYFNKGLGDLPPADAPEPVAASKKAKKLTIASVTPKATRRESRSAVPTGVTTPGATSAGGPQAASAGAAATTPVAAATPGSATSPQGTYALQPDGLPLIRRDSAAGDGRPKREIHRPPPRDLPYSAKPKKKKFQLELKFCETVCTEMNKRKYLAISYPFLQPVDPVALNIPTYHKVIKKPMDFGTVTSKLKNGHYENAKEFHADVKLIFDNCFKFNPEKDDINKLGKSFQQLFDSLWAKKDEWLAEHAPVSTPQSPISDDGEDEGEEEDDEGEDERAAKLLQIQQQISALSAEAQKMFQQSKRTPPKGSGGGGGGGSKKEKSGSKSSGTKASRKSGSMSGPGGSSSAKTAPKKKKAKPAPITHAQKQEIADAITSLQGQDMLNAIQIIRNGVPSMKVCCALAI